MTSELEAFASPTLAQTVEYQVCDFFHGAKVNKKWLWHVATSKKKDPHPAHVAHADDVDFQKQLDKVALWFEKWNHNQRCCILEHLVLIGDYYQFQLLWTAVQPVLHKDFMFAAKGRYPCEEFTPLSTEYSRAARARLTRNRLIQKYYRQKSAYVRVEDDVKQHTGLLPPVEIRPLTKVVSKLSNDSYLRLPALHKRKSLTHPTDYVEFTTEDPTANWRTAMQVRRHLQTDDVQDNEETNPTSPPHSANLYKWYCEWDGPKRATLLQLALMKLDPRQLYFLSAFLSVRRHRDIVSLLPRDIAHNILSYLSPTDLSSCTQVCSTWKNLCKHNVIWRRKCDEGQLDLRPISTPRLGGWRSAYRKDRLLKMNWKHGQYHRTVLIGHFDSVLCVNMNKKYVASGGKDCTVRIWSLATCRLLHTFIGHQKGVWAVAIVSDHLVASGSYDRSVKIWGFGSSKTGCLRTFFGHQGPIWAMVCRNRYLATGSQDRLIKVWNIRHCTLQHTLQGHTSTIFCMDADEHMNRLFSGSADKTVRVWDVMKGSCLRVIWSGEPTSIMALSYSHGLLAFTSGGKVTVWNPSDGNKVRSFKAHKERIESVKLRLDDSSATSGVIVTGGKDGRLKYWNVFGNGDVKKLDEHSGQINAVCADAVRIVTASYDKTLIVWDFREQRPATRNSAR